MIHKAKLQTLCLLGFWLSIAIAQAQTIVPTRELKVGIKTGTIRNIGSFQADSALIFPKREAQDTLENRSRTLRKKGAFFYDSSTHITWFYNGEHFSRLLGSSIYTQDDSIRKQNRTVYMNGHGIFFQNNKDHGMIVLKNEGNDNFLKIEADDANSNKKMGGIWLTGKTDGGDYKGGFKMVNNSQNKHLEFYLTRKCDYDQSMVTPSTTKSLDSKVLAINQEGELVISGINGTNSGCKASVSGKLPTLKFQREGTPQYYFLRFDDARNRLFFGKQEDNFKPEGSEQKFRNRMSIDDNVVIIGPKKSDPKYNVDYYLDVHRRNPLVIFTSQGIDKQYLNDVPSLFVNGTIQASAFLTSSDSVLKRDVHSLQNVLPKLMQLRAVSYYYKDTSEGSGFGSRLQFGFIAQELQRVFPQLVQPIWSDRGTPTLGVNYVGIIAPVVAAVQELYHNDQSQAQKQQELEQSLATELKAVENLEQRVQVLEKILQQKHSSTSETQATLE